MDLCLDTHRREVPLDLGPVGQTHNGQVVNAL